MGRAKFLDPLLFFLISEIELMPSLPPLKATAPYRNNDFTHGGGINFSLGDRPFPGKARQTPNPYIFTTWYYLVQHLVYEDMEIGRVESSYLLKKRGRWGGGILHICSILCLVWPGTLDILFWRREWGLHNKVIRIYPNALNAPLSPVHTKVIN